MDDWITQIEAAELRGLSVQVINNWVRRGRIRSTEIYGKVLVSRADVLSYEPGKGGRPPNSQTKTISNDKKKGESKIINQKK